MTITGNTRLCAILADPVAQVRTPQALNDYFAAHGTDAVLVPIHVAPDHLEAVLQGLRHMQNLDGFVVTVPHKQAICALCDELGAAARAVGAVNTVHRTPDGRLLGDTFDGAGFVAGLRDQGHDPAGRRALLLGAGGAASSVAFALVEAGVARLTIANRTAAKAQRLVDILQRAWPAAEVRVGPADPADHDLVVNATSLGMRPGDPLPLDAARLRPGTLVAEVIMKPRETALLQAARARGCEIHHGHHMLAQQVALIARFLCGGVPQQSSMDDERRPR
ncbi:shikimate dehydrogenase [Castellaniella sp.]|uniref:shikimate dehydrogenase family protein n=1 Tax=Castellaniella sp. TaxID=1955812 RepID=UPI003568F288